MVRVAVLLCSCFGNWVVRFILESQIRMECHGSFRILLEIIESKISMTASGIENIRGIQRARALNVMKDVACVGSSFSHL